MFRLWQRWGRHTRAWRWQASWRAARVTWESAASGEVMQRWLVIHPPKQYRPSSFVHDWLKVLNMDPDVMAMLQKSISAKVIWHIMHWSPTNVIPSIQLCPTVIGQACMDVVVNPPGRVTQAIPAGRHRSGQCCCLRQQVVDQTLDTKIIRLMGCWPLWPSEPSWWQTLWTPSRGSPATLCRAPCTPSPRFTCHKRQ